MSPSVEGRRRLESVCMHTGDEIRREVVVHLTAGATGEL